ncbi:MAG: galactose-1-phosphate uridylyltransferase [Candidatus Omnitrophota bacterium]|nr:MAG: galactose-1-phosphate uridylyltransferase [Candidatus Omnitrophota bacterium]
MDQLRKDPITGRWVIVFTDKPRRPKDFEIEADRKGTGPCPFCYGHEGMTPPEIQAHREGATSPNSPGWSTRVVPNKFPALKIEGDLNRQGLGMFDMSNGVGAHEVIIETPDHNKTLADLMDHEVEKVIWAYRDRSVDLHGDKRFRYIMLFKNQGYSAGASLSHSHSQLIALPMVPKNVREELIGSTTYYEYRERCIFCDMISQETGEKERVICENSRFMAFAPFASRFPFEVWILPKEHHSDFSLIRTEDVIELARILKEVLLRIKYALGDPPYNFIIHTAPIEQKEREDYHWHIEIMPKLMRIAGFEWGSGFYINPTPAEIAAQYLREANLNR